MQRHGAVDEADGVVRNEGDEALSDGVGEFPVAVAGVNFPAHAKDAGMKAAFEADLAELFVGVGHGAQTKPAFRRIEVMRIRRLQRRKRPGHTSYICGWVARDNRAE